MLMRFLPVLLGAASLAVAGHAAAQPYDGAPDDELVVTGVAPADVGVRAERVSFADLDLSGPAGAHTLLMRIRGAAERVCSPQPSVLDIRDNADYRDCRYDSMARAVDQLDQPLVTEDYEDGE